jgi:pyrroloquinoline quinone (PQQ) biosynthesis protein C
MGIASELSEKLDKMCNDQFESAEFKHLLSMPLTLKRAQFYIIQNALYTSNRRDCWAYAQGAAPLEVKKSIWKHESDELINDPRANTDHYTLTVRQGDHLGLKPEDFTNAEIPSMVRACFYAWHNIAMRGPWLSAYTASHMLERRNNGRIVKGGGMSFRMGKKFEQELGISFKKMASLDLHVVADVIHSDDIDEVLGHYIRTEQDRDLALQGAEDSMAVDRAYRGALAYYMERVQ